MSRTSKFFWSQGALRSVVSREGALRPNLVSLETSMRGQPRLGQAVLSVALLGVALTGCGPKHEPVQARRPPEAPAPVDSFYSAVGAGAAGAYEVKGAAMEALNFTGNQETRSILKLDFEDSSLGILQPFAGENGPINELKKLSRVADDAPTDGKALQIEAGLDAPVAYRTPPIPVEPTASYTLTWQERTTDLKGAGDVRNRLGTVEPLFFGIPPYNHDPGAALNTEEKRRKAIVQAPATVRGPQHEGTTTWQTHTVTFTPPPKANYMILSFDHSRSADNKAPSAKASGEVWYDNITLTTTDKPLFQRYGNPDDLNKTPSPLQLRVEQPAPDRGAETRYALYAPAPSQLEFKRKVPENGALSVAAAVLREGWSSQKSSVTFKVNLTTADGSSQTLWTTTVNPARKETDRYWQDTVIDLASFAGQEVTLSLVTESDAQDPFAGAAAVWGDPILFSRKAGGRLVVLTVLDTVTAHHSSLYGYNRNTTPELERIGNKGVVFENAYSAAPWTLPSFASLFTGVDAARHGAGERAWGEVVWRRPLPDRFTTLAEALRSQGFQTVAFMNNPYLTSTFGLGQGFTTYRDYGVGTKTGAGEIGVDHAVQWLQEHSGYDRFMVVHLMDAHGPYRPPMAFARKFSAWFYTGRFEGGMGGQDYLDLAEGKLKDLDDKQKQQVKDLYDGGLAYADQQTGRLYDAVQKFGNTSDITFMVTSDHGEELFEHGGYEHGHQAYNEMLKVPLLVEAPAYFDGGKRVSTPVRLTDVSPTLLDLMKVEKYQGIDGYSLTNLVNSGKPDWQEPRTIFAENELYGSAQNALVQGPWKYLYNMTNTGRAERRKKATDRHELYQLTDDPGEQTNVSTQNGETLQKLHVEMDKHVRPMMAGRYVIALDSGGKPRTFKGTLQLPPGATWFQHYEDMIAPLENGAQGAFQVITRGGQLQFSVTTSRALLSFKPEKMPATGRGIDMAITVDDALWTEGVMIGNGSQVGTGQSALRLADEQLMIAPETIPDAVSGKVSIFVGRTTERSLSTAQDKALPAETEERLRALGYIQ